MTQLSQTCLFLLLIAMLTGCSTLGYYSQAITGHVSLMMSGQPLTDLLTDEETSPVLRQRLDVALQARDFAEQQLGLPVGGAFSDFVRLERPWVVVNLVATPEFSLTPQRWCYPVAGCQAYRGYFDLEAARAEQEQFRARGFDTLIGGVTAYSTLGWFDDPLHTGFTRLPEDRMVALMFHELAHRVVYIPEDTAFNESFATAVELEGLRLWLSSQGESGQFEQALERLERRNQTLALVEDFSARLNSLYARSDQLPEPQLRADKATLFEDLNLAYGQLARDWPEPGPFGAPPVNLNNANLALFRQYNQYVPAFRQLLRDHNTDFARFYQAVEQLATEPPPERTEYLASLSERFDEHF